MTATDQPTLTYRMVTDPEELFMVKRQHGVYSAVTGYRRVRKLHDGSGWLWQTDTGAEGTVPTLNEALTMIALHTPDLRHLTELPIDG